MMAVCRDMIYKAVDECDESRIVQSMRWSQLSCMDWIECRA